MQSKGLLLGKGRQRKTTAVCMSRVCLVMAASIAWLSVIVKRGATVVVPSKIVKCNWEDTLGEVFEKAAPHLQTSTFYQIKIAKKDHFVTTQEVASIDAPVSVCDQFACKYICYMLVESTNGTGVGASVGGMPRPLNAFEILMSSSSRIVLPPRILSEAIRGDQSIYNKFFTFWKMAIWGGLQT